MSRLLAPILALALAALAGAQPAEDPGPRSADAVTDRGRSLDHILDRILAGNPHDAARTLVLLVDPSPALVTARFLDALAGALERASSSEDIAIGLGVVGGRPLFRLAPGADRKALLAAVKQLLDKPRNSTRDVMSAVRQAVLALRGRTGRREIALFSLENGDGEADLEATAAALARSGTVLHCVGRAAFLADSYWVRLATSAPRNLDMRGQDAAYDDLPWGWLLQRSPANETVSSGFGMFGMSRLVSASGGRYYLFYPRSTTVRSCGPYTGCRLCPADHADCGTVYRTHKLRDIAPPLVSRVETRRILARDSLFVAVLRVWGKASSAGLISSRPPLRTGPGLLREERRRTRVLTPWMNTANFASVSRRAAKLAVECERLAREIREAIDYADPARTSKRSLAIAETTRGQLLVTRLNLRLLQAFCNRAPGWLARPTEGLLPPEKPLFDASSGYRGIAFTAQCFCHGTERVMRLEIPGLVEAETERKAAFAAVERLIAKYDGTPFGRVARTMGVSIFYLTLPARRVTTTRRIPGTDDDDDTTTGGSDRPSRSGGGDGSGGGATTGGE